MKNMNNPERVAEQYATSEKLQTRSSVWQPGPDGISPQDKLWSLIVAEQPATYLETGAGTGELAELVRAALPDTQLTVTDFSAAMVEQERARGFAAQQMSVEDLSFADGSFDIVVAAWMLYHVPNLDKGLAQVRRVLKPGGLFLAATNSDRHLAELKELAGLTQDPLPFSAENGAEILRRHFDDVQRLDLETTAVFPDRAAVVAYLQTMAADTSQLPEWEGERRFTGRPAIFVCR